MFCLEVTSIVAEQYSKMHLMIYPFISALPAE